MDNEQHAWARGELDKVYPDPDNKVRQAVTALLSVWTRVDKIDQVQQEQAIKVFSNLALMRPLEAAAAPEGPRRVWAPASQYAMNARFARVRLDTITENNHWKYNDRVGEINSVRRGYMTVTFLDEREGAPSGYHGTVREFDVDISHLVQLKDDEKL